MKLALVALTLVVTTGTHAQIVGSLSPDLLPILSSASTEPIRVIVRGDTLVLKLLAARDGLKVHPRAEASALARKMQEPRRERVMNLIVVLIVLLFLFGGGGFYMGGPAVGGSLGGLILLILIIMLVSGRRL